ncbi:site-specific integrase [Paracoccus sp. p4-l81]|uniref:site-specific integrase n=1 Tax=Paracoccus sp. p4-l81 TaxID=3342806 RepID=UPI0035B77222
MIERAPHIELPQKPAPKDRWLTDAEITKLLTADAEPHIRLAMMIMLATAARVGAVLELTWDRVDLDRNQIDLRLDAEGPRKGRAVVPITSTLRAALAAAAESAISDHVIEWAGGPVKSIRTGFSKAVSNAGLKDVSPHVLRHTAGVKMAAAGIPMPKISQFMGHSNTSVTERVYARFAPDHLADAAAALDFGPLRVVK